MSWTQGYSNLMGTTRAEPVYLLVIPRAWGETIAAYAADETDFETEKLYNFSWGVGDKVLVYDRNGWELIQPQTEDDSGSYYTLGGCERGVGGSVAQSFVAASMMMNPHLILGTSIPTSCGLDVWPYMSMPSGHSCSLLYQEGRTQIGGVDIEVSDVDNQITRKMENFVPIGKPAVILGGYVGLPFYAYTVLYTGSIRSLSYVGGKYQLSLQADLEKLNQTLYGPIEDFDTELMRDVSSSTSILPTISLSRPYKTGNCTATTGTGTYAAIYWKVDDEIMRQTTGSPGISAIVSRGELGTVAASHTKIGADGNPTPVKMFFSIQDNPVNILLRLLLSGNTQYTDQGTYDLYFGADADGSVGVRYRISSVDVERFESVRDDWFPSDVWRVDIASREKMRAFIEDNLLKPMNANLFVDRTGKLSLAAIVPNTPTEYTTLTESDIVGAPRIEFSTEPIINEVTVKYDYDSFEDEYGEELQVIDATSQSTYDRPGEIVIEARGVHPLFGGETAARVVAMKKLSNYKDAQATISFQVLFHKGAAIEPGGGVQISHGSLPDISSGSIGMEDVFVIVGKRINWSTGAVEFSAIKPNYTQAFGRTGLISPTGMGDYTAESAANKAKYVFLSDSDGKMSNGDDGYVYA